MYFSERIDNNPHKNPSQKCFECCEQGEWNAILQRYIKIRSIQKENR